MKQLKTDKINGFILVSLFVILISSFTSAAIIVDQGKSISDSLSLTLDRTSCENNNDLLVEVPYLSCTPQIVRSDLLEEQDVDVYCPLFASSLNPFLTVGSFEGVDFSGSYDSNIRGVGFVKNSGYSSKGISVSSLETAQRIGYATLRIKKQPNESAMPDFVEANLSARIHYTPEHSQDYQTQQFILRKLNDYESGLKENGFWDDTLNIQVESVNSQKARIILNDASLKEIANVELSPGQISQEIEIPGIGVCDASMVIKLDSISLPETYARLIIDGRVVEVTKGSKILNGVCTVTEIVKQGLFETVSISCGKNNLAQLANNPKVKLRITSTDQEGNPSGNPIEESYKVGDLIKENVIQGGNTYNLFLGYIGKDYKGDLIIVPFLSTAKTSEEFLKSASVLRSSLNYIDALDNPQNELLDWVQLGTVVIRTGVDSAKTILSSVLNYLNNLLDLVEKPITIPVHTPLAIYVLDSVQSSSGRDTTFYSLLKSKNLVNIPKIDILGLAGPLNTPIGTLESYYSNAKEQYEKIIKEYAQEKDPENPKRTLAETAYLEWMRLANELGQSEDLYSLCEEIKINYPESYLESDFSTLCTGLVFSNSESNAVYLEARGQVYSVFLKEVYEPGKNDYGVEVNLYSSGIISNEPLDLGKDEKAYFPSTADYIVLKNLDETKASFDVFLTNTKDNKIVKSTVNVNLGETYSLASAQGYQIRLNKINLRRSARVSVIPKFNQDYSDVKFSIKIGIEKRAVKLVPEKTLEAIKNVNKTLEDLNKTSQGLGKVVSGLNKACTAAQTVFTIKNFFAGLSGEGLARQKIMRGAGGWTEKCTQEASKENSQYLSIEDCFLKNSEEIDSQVEGLTLEMDKVNQEIQTIKTSLIDKEATKQSEEFIKQQCAKVSEKISASQLTSLKDMVSSGKCIENWKSGKFTEEDLTEISLYAGIVSSQSDSFNLKTLAGSKLNSLEELTTSLPLNSENSQGSYTLDSWGAIPEKNKIRVYKGYTVLGKNVLINEIQNSPLESGKNYPIAIVLYNSNRYLIILQEIEGSSGSYYIAGNLENKQIYSIKNNILPKPGNQFEVEKIPTTLQNEISAMVRHFETYDAGSYNNPYKNPELRYYETEPYKGMPAVVPFNKTHGWYAAMKQTLPVGSAITPIDESGKRVNSFYLCNVGKNGIEEFFLEGFGDDICALMNLNTGQSFTQFAGLTTSEAATLVDQAVNAIQQAQSAYKPGLKQTTILGQPFAVGAPAVNTPSVQCQDVMSPKECNIMFNLCDPVTCPSSRCDFGGAYPVSDVVQTGIIGSIALCLPNAKEGIAIPVCLTGVQAGVDGLMSVQKSYRDCLQENLENGKTVGICDEIMSIYYCEFLFEQAGPLLTELGASGILSALESAAGSGGGEYLYASDAIGNAKRSYQYFTQTYSTESQSIFSSQTLQGLGKGICKTFISTAYPSTAEGLNQVQQTTEPVNSPPQYHARFDEIVLTTASVPATSQYKVFYHIFAGNEAGVYYSVYLKGGDELSYYQDTNKIRTVASGFVEKGNYASETKDFSAPAGYKQLCISVNGKEECGFKQVSTSLAVDYLTDKYLAEQASSTEIITESECISGRLNWGALLNLNAQSAASELIDPAIYNKGITRMCATKNPGIGTDSMAETSESRWVSVGYCDDPAMKCWLDTQEVKEILNSPDLAKFISNGETDVISDNVLENVEEKYLNFLEDEGKYLTEEDLSKIIEYLDSKNWASKSSSDAASLNEINLKIKELTGKDSTSGSLYDARIKLIDEVYSRAVFTKDKAKLILLKAEVYAELARKNKSSNVPDVSSL